MAYQANVLNVMIASPGDVDFERNSIREAVHEWNAIHSRTTGTVLMPVGWETHSAPDMSASAQEVINKQITDDSDLLIAVFWTRIGTPTDNAQSGTVEEIKKHIDSGRPAMIYFSKTPVEPDSVDPNQYAALKQFKKECERKGLYETYENRSEFQTKIRRQLAMKIIELRSKPESSVDDGQVEKSVPKLPTISFDAQTMLTAAALDDGEIWFVEDLTGFTIQVGSRQFGDGKSNESMARWQAVIDELLDANLLMKVARQQYRVTQRGYDLVRIIDKG